MKKMTIGLAIIGCVLLALFVCTDDGYATADHGTSEIPLAEIDTNAYDFLGATWYVLPNSPVTIVPYSSGGTEAVVTSITEGYGLTLTDGAVSGTIIGNGGSVSVTVIITESGTPHEYTNAIFPNALHTYSIAYDSNGGVGDMSDSVDITSLGGFGGSVLLKECEYTKEGFAFIGWTIDGVTYLPGARISNIYQDMSKVAVAQWTSSSNPVYTHTITYMAGSGSGTMTDTVVTDHIDGKSYVTLASNGFTREGYTFTGWRVFLNNTHSEMQCEPNTKVEVDAGETVTAVAQWTLNASAISYTHTVTYLPNGGTGTMTDSTVTNNSNLPSAITLSTNEYTRSGYTFLGWRVMYGAYVVGYTYLDLDGILLQSGDDVLVYADRDVIAIAQWESTSVTYTHTVTYDVNGGVGTIPDSVVTDHISGNSFVYLTYTEPYKASMMFTGWLINGNIYQKGQPVLVAGNTTVIAIAQWETAYTHTITYDANGGSGSMYDTVVRNTVSGITNVTLASSEFTYTGHSFLGWSVNGTLYQPGNSVPVSGNTTVMAIAQWSENTLTAYANNIIGYSERTYTTQIYTTVSAGGQLTYNVISVSGGSASVDTNGLVTYIAPSVISSQTYTMIVSVSAVFPNAQTVTVNVTITASIDPTPIGVIIDSGVAERDIEETDEGYYVKDTSYKDMDVTLFIGPQYTEKDESNIMDDVPIIRMLVGIIPLLMITGIIAYVARGMTTSRR